MQKKDQTYRTDIKNKFGKSAIRDCRKGKEAQKRVVEQRGRLEREKRMVGPNWVG